MDFEYLIFCEFISGFRINVESFRRWGDYNIYLDEKLIRIYYVHRFKPCSYLDNSVGFLTRFGISESEAINLIIEFIKDYPNIYNYAKKKNRK